MKSAEEPAITWTDHSGHVARGSRALIFRRFAVRDACKNLQEDYRSVFFREPVMPLLPAYRIIFRNRMSVFHDDPAGTQG